MDRDRTLDMLANRPGMLGLDGSFGQRAAFVEGLDTASDGSFLVGFREWLIVRAGFGNNLTWQGLVLHLALDGWGERESLAKRTAEDEVVAGRVLVDLLVQFLSERDAPYGLIKIHDRYLTWLRAQDWYRPVQPQYRQIEGDSTG